MKPSAIKIPPAATNGIMYETPVISQRRTLEAELTEVPFLLEKNALCVILYSVVTGIHQCVSNTPEEWSSNSLGILFLLTG